MLPVPPSRPDLSRDETSNQVTDVTTGARPNTVIPLPPAREWLTPSPPPPPFPPLDQLTDSGGDQVRLSQPLPPELQFPPPPAKEEPDAPPLPPLRPARSTENMLASLDVPPPRSKLSSSHDDVSSRGVDKHDHVVMVQRTGEIVQHGGKKYHVMCIAESRRKTPPSKPKRPPQVILAVDHDEEAM